MKKSKQVAATFIVSIAASFVNQGCSSTRQECRDATGKVVNESYCRNRTSGYMWHSVRTGGFGGSSSGVTS